MSSPPAEQPDGRITESQRTALLAALIDRLSGYVLPEVAADLQEHLRQRHRQGAYQTITDGAQLADIVTNQLQALSKDRQLCLYFSPAPLPDLPDAGQLAPEATEAERHRSSTRNFDINRVERLRGNVGYLELYGFEPPQFAGDVLAAAMTFLAHTQALILDIRHCRGGTPALVACLCSYLFPPHPPLHLSDLHWHLEETTRQWWTLDHLAGPRYLHKPVYILTSEATAAAAEEFAYTLQAYRRGVIVGEHTSGNANPGQGYRLNDHFWVFIPTGQCISPVTGSNWAGTGVIPDVKVPAELSLLTAHLKALNTLLANEVEGAAFRELQHSALLVERELNAERAALISQLKQPMPQNP